MDEHVRGKVTGVALDNVTALTLPFVQDPWGRMRPPLSVDAMRLSIELAGATYHMDVDPWLQAGWRDVTIQCDTELVTGFVPKKEPSSLEKLAMTFRLNRIRARMRQRNPLGQVAGALRQLRQSDTGKVLVMCHPAPDGRYVVAISFMGTGSRFYDWFSNFRMSSDEGVHKGFLQLARQFESNEEKIIFPDTAEELGLKGLTLSQIIREAAAPRSRFVLWLSGHSQGGALTQVYCWHKMKEDRVMAENIVGWGFASPSALEARAEDDPASYPLYHVLNGDDVVPRMGAQIHLGVCLHYRSDERIRRACYAWPRDEQSILHRAKIRPLVEAMDDTEHCIIAAVAYLNALSEKPVEEMAAGLGVFGQGHATIGKLLGAADARIGDVMRFVRRHTSAAYESITGHAIDPAQVAPVQDAIRILMAEMGVKAFAGALVELMSWPHTCNARKGAFIGSYPFITLSGVEQLRPFVWVSGPAFHKEWVDEGRRGIPSGEQVQMLALINRRPVRAIQQPRMARRYSQVHPRTETRHRVQVAQRGSLRIGEKIVQSK